MNNLQDLLRGAKSSKDRLKNSIAVFTSGPVIKPAARPQLSQKGPLPRAAAIYGAAAAIFAVITIFYLFKGQWVTGLIMILPTFCLGGFAWHYMRD
jgi:hypothetical protein